VFIIILKKLYKTKNNLIEILTLNILGVPQNNFERHMVSKQIVGKTLDKKTLYNILPLSETLKGITNLPKLFPAAAKIISSRDREKSVHFSKCTSYPGPH